LRAIRNNNQPIDVDKVDFREVHDLAWRYLFQLRKSNPAHEKKFHRRKPIGEEVQVG
jgi:hypothetical protein